MTPCSVVLITILWTVVAIDARFLRHADEQKTWSRRSPRNRIQYPLPKFRRLMSNNYRREFENEGESPMLDLTNTIQQQVADQIKFQQELQKKIQDRIKEKLSGSFHHGNERLPIDTTQGSWYSNDPEGQWWDEDGENDPLDSFLVFDPSSARRRMTNRANTPIVSSVSVSQRMAPSKDKQGQDKKSVTRKSQQETSSSSSSPVKPLSQAPAERLPPGNSIDAEIDVEGRSPIVGSLLGMGIPGLGAIPGLSELMKLGGMISQLTKLLNMGGLGGAGGLGGMPFSGTNEIGDVDELSNADDEFGQGEDLNGPYSMSFNDGKSAWNVNVNPGALTRRQSESNDPYAPSDEYNPYDEEIYASADQTNPLTDGYLPETDDLQEENNSYGYEDGYASELGTDGEPPSDPLEEQSIDDPQCMYIHDTCGWCTQQSDNLKIETKPMYEKTRRLKAKVRLARRAQRRRPRSRRLAVIYSPYLNDNVYTLGAYEVDMFRRNPGKVPYVRGILYDAVNPPVRRESEKQLVIDCDKVEELCAKCVIQNTEPQSAGNYGQESNPIYDDNYVQGDDPKYDAAYVQNADSKYDQMYESYEPAHSPTYNELYGQSYKNTRRQLFKPFSSRRTRHRANRAHRFFT